MMKTTTTTAATNSTVTQETEKATDTETTTINNGSSSNIVSDMAIASNDVEGKIDSLTAGALPYFNSIFKQLMFANAQNADILCEFVTAEHNESNVKLSTRLTHIKIIYSLTKFLKYKDFLQITKQDIMQYLSALRKTELQDPSHKWIGTYNTRQMVLSKFFKWLYNQNEPDHKKRIGPPCMQGVKPLPRKENSPYTPSDIWNNEEHAVFLGA